jgi:DNA-binding GntR family transcriptional regulator
MARLGKFSISIGTIRGFRDRLQLFRLTNATVPAANWRSEIVTEHRAILNGIQDASVQEAAKALQEHLIATGKRLLPQNVIQIKPGFAAD